MKILDDESGQTTILVAIFTAILLLGLAALAVDVGMLYREKRMVQNAADAAALAASAQYGTTDINTSAATAAHQQPGIIASGTNVATITSTLVNAANSDVQVVVTQPTPTVFMRAFNSAFGLIRISAVAEAAKPPVAACINALSPSGVTSSGYPTQCSTTGGIIVGDSSTSTAEVQSTGCSICSDSAITTCDSYQGWISSTLSINAGGGVTGKVTATNGISGAGGCTNPYASVVAPSYTSGCTTITWPGGSGGGQHLKLASNLGGAPYCGFGVTDCSTCLGSLELTGGVYIFSKSFNIGSGVSITEDAPVTLYFAPGTDLNGGNGSVQRGFDNGMSINITAMTTGSTAGIAIWDDSGTAASPDTFTFNGGSSSKINGAIYAPHSTLQDGNGSGVTTVNGSITAWAIEVGGGGGLSVSASDSSSSSRGPVTLVK